SRRIRTLSESRALWYPPGSPGEEMLIPRSGTARFLPFHRLLGYGLLMEAGFAVLGRPDLSVPARVSIQSATFILYLFSLREGSRLPLTGGRLAAILGL